MLAHLKIALLLAIAVGGSQAAAAANFIVSGELKFIGGDPSVERVDLLAIHAGQEIDRIEVTRRDPHFVFPVSSEFFYRQVCLDVQRGDAVARTPTCIDNPAQVAAAVAPGQFANTVPGQIVTITELNTRIAGDLDALENAIEQRDWEGAQSRVHASGEIARKLKLTRRFYTLWASLIFKARAENGKLARETLEVTEVLRRGEFDSTAKSGFETLSPHDREALLVQFKNGLEQGFDHGAPIDGGDRRIFNAVIDLDQWLHDEFSSDGTWILEAARFCSNLRSVACMRRVPLDPWANSLRAADAIGVREKTNLAVSAVVLANSLWPYVITEGCCDVDVQELNATFLSACDLLDSVDRALLQGRQYRIVRQVRDNLGV